MDTAIDDPLLYVINEMAGISATRYLIPPERLVGGYDTEVWFFQLADAPAPFDRKLVLRRYPPHSTQDRAIVEGCVQRALAHANYPAPHVHLICNESSALGNPFIVMDWAAGDVLLILPEPDASIIMGETHARLHLLDAKIVADTLRAQGLTGFGLDQRLKLLQSRASPWVAPSVEWLVKNRPEEKSLAICHGDFHKLNILTEHGAVTGVLDWSNFSIMEAAFDVACTQLSFEIISKHLIAAGDFEITNLERVVQDYLESYERILPLDTTNLEYYRVLRATIVLTLAELGVEVFQHQGISTDLRALIHHSTGLELNPSAGRPTV